MNFLEAAAALGDVPLIAGGDLNTNGQYSRVLEAAFATGDFVDAAVAWAAKQGKGDAALDPTCFPEEGQPSRADVVVLNQCAADMLVGYEVLASAPR